MSLIQQVSYIGKGSVFLKPRGSATARRVPIGNVAELTLEVAEEEKKLADYESLGGGTLDKVSRIESVTGAAKTSNHNPANLALALRGTSAVNAGATITDEAHVDVQLGSLVALARLPDAAQPVTVSVGVTPISAAGNWELNPAGIWIYPDAADIIAGDDLLVSYTALPDNLIQALVASAAEYELMFVGLNEARSGKPVVVTAHRCSFSPTKGLALIADDFGNLELGFELLADATISGAGLSRYLTVRMAEQAA
jgi:hypothetical protein